MRRKKTSKRRRERMKGERARIKKVAEGEE